MTVSLDFHFYKNFKRKGALMEYSEIEKKAFEVSHHLDGTATVELVGRWIWVTFERKPDKYTREYLKGEKFYWNRSRACWQCNNGHHSKNSPHPAHVLKIKYGAIEINEKERGTNEKNNI